MQIRFISVLLIFLLYTTSFAEQSNTFSDEDLKSYRHPSDNRPYVPTIKEETNKDKKTRIDEEREKEWWCEKGTNYTEKVEAAKRNYKEAEKKLDDAKSDTFWGKKGGSKIKSCENKLAKAKKQLEDAEKKLMDFEQKAHRKGIPPGWLRCQFM